jgi:hypothetical protein
LAKLDKIVILSGIIIFVASINGVNSERRSVFRKGGRRKEKKRETDEK